MPPKQLAKRNSVAADPKQKKGGSKKDNVGFSQPVIVQNSKNTFSERLEKAREEHKTELEDLLLEMDNMKKENGRLRRQQEDVSGVTMDTVSRMKKELDHARTTRMFLMEDINIRKEKCEKMEAEIFELNMKLESYTRQLHEYRQLKEEWEETSEKLARTEEKCDRLTKTNKKMKMLLLRHHIDPKVDDSAKKRQAQQKPVKMTTGAVKAQQPPKNTHSFTHLGQNKAISRSLEDIREKPDVNDINQRLALTSRRQPPGQTTGYSGFYTNIHNNRMQLRNRLAATTANVHLPRVAVQ